MRTLYLLPWDQVNPDKFTAGRLVLTPNRRAAAGLGCAPASLESLARKHLGTSKLSIVSNLVGHRLLVKLIATQFQVSDPEGTARSITPVLRTFLRAGVDLEALASDANARVANLAAIAAAYQKLLRDQGLIDSCEVMRMASGSRVASGAILVTGYPRLGLDERAFVDAVAGDGSIVLLPYVSHPLYEDNLDAAAYFAERGWTIEKPVGEAVSLSACFAPAASVKTALVYENQEAEVRGAMAQIKELLYSGVPADEIVLVARNDSNYGPLALDVAWEYGILLRALYLVPLAETRFGAWVKQLAEAIRSDLAFEPTFRWLAHPISPWFPETKRAEARSKHPAGVEAWRALDLELESLLWPDSETRGQWKLILMRLLKDLGVRKRSARWPQAALAFRTFTEALNVTLSESEEVVPRDVFIRELLDVLNLLSVPAQPGRGGVELHTPLSLFGARYQHVIVMGMAENILPAPVSNSAVLDFHDRQYMNTLGFDLENAAMAARREFLSFAALLQTARASLTLSYPRLMGTKQALPSVYFERLGLTPQAIAAQAVFSPEEARRIWLARGDVALDPLLSAAEQALNVERRRESAEPPDEFDGIIGLPMDPDERVFSPSQLTVLGQCPYKWFVQYALKLALPDEPEDDLAMNTRGSLYHKALELAVEAARNEPNLREGVLMRLDWALRKAEQDETIKLPSLTAWEGRRREHLTRLTRAVNGVEFHLPGATVRHLERKFETTWRGLRVRGTVDRIDETAEGLVFMDYKTSGSPPKGAQDAAGHAKLDLQLPIYIEAAAQLLEPGKPVARAMYYSLTKGEVLAEAQAGGAGEALDDFVQLVRRRLHQGEYPVTPDRKQDACTYCDFKLLCRVGPRVGRKERQP